MSRKSPFTEWVFSAWDELVLDKGAKLSLDERRSRWLGLYHRTYVDGKWIVGVDDAALVASLGETLAMIADEYERARDLLRQFFLHPDLTPKQLVREYESLFIREAIADILCGNVEDAIERLRQPLHAPDRENVLLNVVRNDLINLMNTLGLGNAANPRITEFVAEVVGCYQGLKRFSQKISTNSTNGELSEALQKTFGR